MAYDIYRLYKGAYYVSGNRWEDNDLPLVEWHDSGSGTYETSWNYSATCYDTWLRRWVGTGITAPVWLQPSTIISYQAPCSITARISETSQLLRIRIESTDGSRWAQLLIDDSIRDAFYTDSESQDHTVDSGYPNYSGRLGLGTLHANTDGKVAYSAGYDTPYDSSCSSSWTSILGGTTANPVFNVGEQLIVKYLFYYSSDAIWMIPQFGFDLTLTATSEELEWLWCEFDPMEGALPADGACMEATQDNSESGLGALIHEQTGPPSQEEQDRWFEFFEDYDVGVAHLWSTYYHRLQRATYNVWLSKCVISFSSEYLEWILLFNYGMMGFISEDGNRWIVITRQSSSPYYLQVISHLGTEWTGSEAGYSDYTTCIFAIRIIEGYLKFQHQQSGKDIITQPPDILFTDIFNAGEKVSPFITRRTDYSYAYLGRQSLIISPELPPPGGSLLLGSIEEFSCSIDTLAETRTCYVKSKIINTQDISDLDSLMFMTHLGEVTDFGKTLKEFDACMVFDKYNRTYVYQLRSGYHVTSLPDYVNVADTYYWELIGMMQHSHQIVPEQYPVVGLVSGSPVTITHSTHNRSYGYAPTVQLIHNGKVRTHGIRIFVKSTTQLELQTTEVAALTNLKINVYVTP
jgi:hypothetical protein